MISPDLRFRTEHGQVEDHQTPPVCTRTRASSDAPVPVPKAGMVSVTSRDAPRGDDASHRSPPQRGALHSLTECSDRRAPGETESAICVQRLDDSLNSAIHTRYRSLLRSSSMHEPRGPPLEVVQFLQQQPKQTERCGKKKKKVIRGRGERRLAPALTSTRAAGTSGCAPGRPPVARPKRRSSGRDTVHRVRQRKCQR